MRKYQDNQGNKYTNSEPVKMDDNYPFEDYKMDNLTVKRIDLMHPVLRAKTHEMYKDMCKAVNGSALVRFAYTLRTFAEQNALYQQGRTKLYDNKGKRLGTVTNAKAGQSYHNYGLAFDIVLLTNNGKSASWDTARDFDGDGVADWMECVKIAKSYGFAWGGDFRSFPDRPHFENRLGYTINDLYRMHQKGMYKNGYLDITG